MNGLATESLVNGGKYGKAIGLRRNNKQRRRTKIEKQNFSISNAFFDHYLNAVKNSYSIIIALCSLLSSCDCEAQQKIQWFYERSNRVVLELQQKNTGREERKYFESNFR